MITRYLAGLILIAMPVFVGNAVAGDLLWIELKSDVSVSTQYYTLGELATRVVAQDSALVANVKRLRIGHAPRMGYSMVVPRSEVLRVIRGRCEVKKFLRVGGDLPTPAEIAKAVRKEM